MVRHGPLSDTLHAFTRRVAPAPMIFPDHNEDAPGPSPLGTGERRLPAGWDSTNPSPSREAGGESWSCRQALSAKLSSNSLIPLAKIPEPFCSLIPQKAHNRIMPQSSRQLDPASPRTARFAKHWSTMPAIAPQSVPGPENTHPPLPCAISSPFRPITPSLRCKQTTYRSERNTHPPFGKFAVFHKKRAYFRPVVFYFSSPSPGPDSARSTMPYS